MRQRVPDMLNQGIFLKPHAPSAVDVSESAERGVRRDFIKAAFQVFAPHVAKSRKRHEHDRGSEVEPPNHFRRHIRRPTEIYIGPAEGMTRADALKCCLELFVADAQMLAAQCSTQFVV